MSSLTEAGNPDKVIATVRSGCRDTVEILNACGCNSARARRRDRCRSQIATSLGNRWDRDCHYRLLLKFDGKPGCLCDQSQSTLASFLQDAHGSWVYKAKVALKRFRKGVLECAYRVGVGFNVLEGVELRRKECVGLFDCNFNGEDISGWARRRRLNPIRSQKTADSIGGCLLWRDVRFDLQHPVRYAHAMHAPHSYLFLS